MSIINSEFQFQVLLLRGTFATAYGAALNVAYSVAHTFASRAAYAVAYRDPYDITYVVASDATSLVAFNAADDIYRAACEDAFNAAYNVAIRITSNIFNSAAHYDARKQEKMDDVMLMTFKEVLKMDSKTREDIKIEAMSKIPIDYKSSRSEKELVKLLVGVNISGMIPLIQTYWIYNIWCCAITSTDLLDIVEEKIKNLSLPQEYMKLLNLLELECLADILITPLIKIVSGYYGLMDRYLFLHHLLKLK